MSQYGTVRQDRGSELLRDALRINNETTIVADGAMDQMTNQREQLESAQYNVQQTKAVSQQAHKKIYELKAKLRTERLVLKSVVALLVAIDSFLIYRLISNGGHL